MYAMRSIIGVATGGTLMSEMEDEAYNLIKEMMLNNYQWSNERCQPKRVGEKSDVDALSLLTSKMDAMTQSHNTSNINTVNACAPSPTCDGCGSFDHLAVNCQVGNPFSPSSSDQVAYVNNL